MFDIIQKALAGLDRFGGGRSAQVPGSEHSSASPAHMPGVTGAAAPGVYSPHAETVLDEREMFYSRSAAFDAKWANEGLLGRALARHRGEKVDDPEIRPEPGAPAKERPLRSVSEVIAEAMATAKKPPSGPAPGPEKPYTGLSPEEEYHQRRAMMDARAARRPPVGGPMKPELGAPAKERPLRSVEEVIAEAMGSVKKPPSGPPPAPEKPYTGLSPEEEYRQRRAMMDARLASRGGRA
jgi:hypothetical protein